MSDVCNFTLRPDCGRSAVAFARVAGRNTDGVVADRLAKETLAICLQDVWYDSTTGFKYNSLQCMQLSRAPAGVGVLLQSRR